MSIVEIPVTTAVGRGRTAEAALDRALLAAGVADRTLVPVRGVLPAGSRLVPARRARGATEGGWGDRLYAVWAVGHASRPGEAVWAGLGWVQDEDTGLGLVVPRVAGREHVVRAGLDDDLDDAQGARRLRLGRPRQRVVGAVCNGVPVCVVVLCALATEPWPAVTRPRLATV